jgi:preprotein translocase subunit SecA
MAQRDPLVEYQREGFDMFAAMMDGVKEESVGFMFNLEVQVDDGPAEPEPEPAEQVGALPQLDLTKLAAAQEEHQHEHEPESRPQIKAKGLDRKTEEKPLIYSAPELGSEAPNVQTTGGGDGAKAGQSATARRQQSRQNPNRGSRGNKGGGSRNKRKR